MSTIKKPSGQTWAKLAYEFRERAEKAEAEVERLTKVLDVCSSVHGHNVKLHEERKQLREALRTVAERQREACAEAMKPVLRSMLSRGQAADLCRATPLVTEGEP